MLQVKQELRKFGESTSIRGVSRIFKVEDSKLKVMWICAVASSAAILSILFIIRFKRIYAWPATTKFGEEQSGHIVFPDITICSLNRFANDNSHSLDNYLEFFRNQQILDISEDDQWIIDSINSVSGFIVNISKHHEMKDDCPPFIADCIIYSENWRAILECKNRFTQVWNAEYHTCFTIRTNTLNAKGTPFIRGMSLVLNNGLPNTVKLPYDISLTSSQSNGVRIAIHSPGTPPDFKRGLTVGPGTENRVQIIQTNIDRLDKPYNTQGCTDRNYLTDSKEAYSRNICVEYCRQRLVFEKCGCLSSWFAVPESLEKVLHCGNFSIGGNDLKKLFDKIRCSSKIASSVDNCHIECLFPCYESKYRHDLVSSPWPSKSFLNGISKKIYEKCDNENGSYSVPNLHDIRESLLVVKLVIEDDYPYNLINKPTYNWDIMLGIVGGMMSLWLGITVMTLVEVVELFYYLVKIIIKK